MKSIIKQWKAETPKVAKYIRNVAGGLSAALGTLKASGVDTPDWLDDSIAYMIFISALIMLIAGTKEKKTK